MKQNIKFFTIVISLLLLSSLVLTGCMYAIASDNGEMKPYDLNSQNNGFDGQGSSVVEDAPQGQNEMREKFSAYLHKDGNTVTVFSEEQYAELKAVRENDKRDPLTYEEILFLVNDSINLYFTCDEIRLTNSNRDNVIPLLSNQSGNARVIYPEYKDRAAYETYSEAETAYNKMLTDIYEIIYYRIYMHDAGFETVMHTYHSGHDLIFGNRYHGNLGMISSAVPQGYYQMLAIDNAAFSGIDNEEKLVGEYKTLLEWKRMYEMDAVIDYEHNPYLNSAVLCTRLLNTNREPMEYRFYIAGPKDEPARQIYPTTELENMMPYREFLYEARLNNGTSQPVFSLNYETGTFAMSDDFNKSFAIIGKFNVDDGVLRMYPSNAGDGGAYSYVLYEQDGTWVYSEENSKPIESAGFDWADGIIFEKVHEGVSTEHSTDSPVNNNKTNPPVNNNNNNSKVEIPYFKLYVENGMCSLMASDGAAVEGTYVQEGDMHALCFDGDFLYVFYCNEDVGYVYAKAESNPIPGYEFEDEAVFSLNDNLLKPTEQ